MSDDPVTPSPLRAMQRTDGDSVSKLDLLLGYVHQLLDASARVEGRLSAGDRRMDDHQREIEALKLRCGRKTKPEPHWAWRAAAIAALTCATTAAVTWLLKGGLAAGVTG